MPIFVIKRERDAQSRVKRSDYMLILLILMLLVPALISVLLYERFRDYELSNQKRILLLLVFSFLINMIVYAALWLRGWDYVSWTLNSASAMTGVSFCLKYMALSLVSAVIIPLLMNLVKIGNRK